MYSLEIVPFLGGGVDGELLTELVSGGGPSAESTELVKPTKRTVELECIRFLMVAVSYWRVTCNLAARILEI